MLSTWRHSFEEINETQLIYLLLSYEIRAYEFLVLAQTNSLENDVLPGFFQTCTNARHIWDIKKLQYKDGVTMLVSEPCVPVILSVNFFSPVEE